MHSVNSANIVNVEPRPNQTKRNETKRNETERNQIKPIQTKPTQPRPKTEHPSPAQPSPSQSKAKKHKRGSQNTEPHKGHKPVNLGLVRRGDLALVARHAQREQPEQYRHGGERHGRDVVSRGQSTRLLLPFVPDHQDNNAFYQKSKPERERNKQNAPGTIRGMQTNERYVFILRIPGGIRKVAKTNRNGCKI